MVSSGQDEPGKTPNTSQNLHSRMSLTKMDAAHGNALETPMALPNFTARPGP
jgi:hypothetical protein